MGKSLHIFYNHESFIEDRWLVEFVAQSEGICPPNRRCFVFHRVRNILSCFLSRLEMSIRVVL